jgi:hypothetical protein
MAKKDQEHNEQVAIFEWAERQSKKHPELLLLFAIPNGGKLPYTKNNKTGKIWSPQRAKLVKEGLKPGVPDIFFPVARNGKHGLFIELKIIKKKVVGGKIKEEKTYASKIQKEWHTALESQGYDVRVCWGADGAINTIRSYLGLSDGLL